MATLTAQILIGHPHSNHDGINPTHYLFLSENDRPAWVLDGQNVLDSDQSNASIITWIPTVEHMLEDALLMIAIHVTKNQGIINMSKGICNDIEWDYLELYSLKENERDMLYQACRNISDFPKIIISVFRGSYIERQLRVLLQYKMDVEVCVPIYSRLYSTWSEKTRIEGSL